MQIKVAIVEDSAEIREGLALFLNRGSNLSCVGAFTNAEDALRQLPQLKPDVVLMDIRLPGMSGVAAIRQLKELLPAVQIMMLTVFEDYDQIFKSLVAGAT